jgi:hypothetical protein
MSGGRIMITGGLLELGAEAVDDVLRLVQTFEEFDPGFDRYQEHDFGCVRHAGRQMFWKIDYYDKNLEFGSPDPADEAVTSRIMTIMLASEY